jgi:hypothetical protein
MQSTRSWYGTVRLSPSGPPGRSSRSPDVGTNNQRGRDAPWRAPQLAEIYLAGGFVPEGGGRAAGIEKLPACGRPNSSWLSWLAVLPLTCMPRFVAVFLWRAGGCAGGIAELAAASIDTGGIAAGGGGAGYGKSLDGLAGRL